MQKPSDSTAMIAKRFLRQPQKGGKIPLPATGHTHRWTITVPGKGLLVLGISSAIPRLFAGRKEAASWLQTL
jgi:hypothetical protein